ncbi:MAG: hypothetical protein JEZ07_14635 [Phycisphaerae bacterium]|nr:hypothetical protein [Phycisphaerae bacterium]
MARLRGIFTIIFSLLLTSNLIYATETELEPIDELADFRPLVGLGLFNPDSSEPTYDLYNSPIFWDEIKCRSLDDSFDQNVQVTIGACSTKSGEVGVFEVVSIPMMHESITPMCTVHDSAEVSESSLYPGSDMGVVSAYHITITSTDQSAFVDFFEPTSNSGIRIANRGFNWTGQNYVLVPKKGKCEYLFGINDHDNSKITIQPSNIKNRDGAKITMKIVAYDILAKEGVESGQVDLMDLNYANYYAIESGRFNLTIDVKRNERLDFDPFSMFVNPGDIASDLVWVDAIKYRKNGPPDDPTEYPSGDYWRYIDSNQTGITFCGIHSAANCPTCGEDHTARYRSYACILRPYIYPNPWCTLPKTGWCGFGCDPYLYGCGCVFNFNTTTDSSSVVLMAKLPAWKEGIKGATDQLSSISYFDTYKDTTTLFLDIPLPGYMDDEGWEAYYSHGMDGHCYRYVKQDLGDLGVFYYHCDRKSKDTATPNRYVLTHVEYCKKDNLPNLTTDVYPGTGEIVWTATYDAAQTDKDKITKLYKGVATSNTYYDFVWNTTNDNIVDVTFVKDSTEVQKWSYEYDDKGDLISSSNGCSSGCSGGGDTFVSYDYYDYVETPDPTDPSQVDDLRFDGLIKEIKDADSNVILGNVYAFDGINFDVTEDNIYTDDTLDDYVYLPEPFLVEQYRQTGSTITKLREWEYDIENCTKTEYIWLDDRNESIAARVIDYIYTDNTFTTLAEKKEYDELYSATLGSGYKTVYDYDETTQSVLYPSGLRKDVVEEYTIDTDRYVDSYTVDMVMPDKKFNFSRSIYNSDGELEKQENSQGVGSEYTYSTDGNMESYTEPLNTNSSGSSQIKVTYGYDDMDRTLWENEVEYIPGTDTEEEIKTTVYVYETDSSSDNFGRLTRQAVLYDNGNMADYYTSSTSVGYRKISLTEYRYDAMGRQNRVVQRGGYVSVSDEGSDFDIGVDTYTLETDGVDPIKITYINNDNTTKNFYVYLAEDQIVQGSEYGLNGHLRYEFTVASADGESPPDPDIAATSSLKVISQTVYDYDEDGRVQYIIRAKMDSSFNFVVFKHTASDSKEYETNFKSSDATGLNEELIDDIDTLFPAANWIVTEYVYDTWGNKEYVREDHLDEDLETRYIYDLQNNVEKTIYPDGQYSQVILNGRGLVESRITGYINQNDDPIEMHRTEYKYNADGNLIEMLEPYIDPQGASKKTKTIYKYDRLGRLKATLNGFIVD